MFVLLTLAFIASTCVVAFGFKPYSTIQPPREVCDCVRLAWFVERFGVNDSLGIKLMSLSVWYSNFNYTLAREYALKALSYYESLYRKAPSIHEHKLMLLAFKSTVAIIIAVLLWRLAPKAYLLVWYRLFSKRRLKLGGGSPSILWDPEVRAVLAAIVVVALVFSVAYPISKHHIEPFTAIGLLGPRGKIGGYPKSVVEGSNISLYIYLHNHEGRVMLYRIDYQVLNQTYTNATRPPPLKVYGRIYVLLADNQSVIIPVKAYVPGSGRLRLTWWLYKYNATVKTYQYSGEWVHLWVQSVKTGV